MRVDSSGFVTPVGNGVATVTATAAGNQKATTQVEVAQIDDQIAINFPNQITPIFSKLGCNSGGCHGKSSGQNGFKLSLRGYDPIYDTRALTDDLAARRINRAAPENSLMLLKATGAVPHVGGDRAAGAHVGDSGGAAPDPVAIADLGDDARHPGAVDAFDGGLQLGGIGQVLHDVRPLVVESGARAVSPGLAARS